MEREPGEFERPDEEVGNGGEDDLDRLIAGLPLIPGLPSTQQEIAAADARAMADIAAGRVYPHKVVGEWLKTWGKPGRQPFKEWLANQDG